MNEVRLGPGISHAGVRTAGNNIPHPAAKVASTTAVRSGRNPVRRTRQFFDDIALGSSGNVKTERFEAKTAPGAALRPLGHRGRRQHYSEPARLDRAEQNRNARRAR